MIFIDKASRFSRRLSTPPLRMVLPSGDEAKSWDHLSKLMERPGSETADRDGRWAYEPLSVYLQYTEYSVLYQNPYTIALYFKVYSIG